MKVVALLTGRGNNTLKDKNVLDILGHPVLYYPAHAAKKAEVIDSYYCSSDDEKILRAAEKEGYERIVRPEYLSLATSQHVDVIKHGIDIISKKEDIGDILVVILANNVTIKADWINACVKMMQDDPSLTAVVPIYEDNDHHPLRGKRVENGRLEMYERGITGKLSTNRQDLPSCYFLSHNFWVLNTKKMIESNYEGQQPWGFMGNNIGYFLIDESIDIHKEIDLFIAKEWIKEHYKE
ncbi:CMP-N-acetylneuraminic acid synthetase [Butyrivibrio proteoclasticus]|uniref:CMP-N-acetylneuraminic acid synthetase n=1 Tax=Butyrivibrio proteoclasticus TaxID=43305 RepID=A0A1I5XNM7_9FIRM|nr:CMP-N-acetylneuraminic acid synthetase [Butyrivibrio proteoclasticus]SFQ33549.1 CMP-N-acetylneuraminic acid synthetase [Butyrivibrio proteoclasticus]